MGVNLKSLIGKLNSSTRGTVEDAAKLAMSRTNHYIDVEHFLRLLWDGTGNDFFYPKSGSWERRSSAARLGHKIRRALGHQFSLKLDNGSQIFAVAHTTDTSVGPTANVLIVDEAALVKDLVYFSVSPTTARTHGTIWLMSTPRRPAGYFYNIWQSQEDTRWHKIFSPVSDCPVFVVATANDIKSLPPEFLRQGRFDEIFFVGLPGKAEREAIFRIHLLRRRRDPKAFHLPPLLESSAGFSGAEIEQAVISGHYRAFENERELEAGDLLTALRETVPLSKSRAKEIAAIYHWADSSAKWASRRVDA